MVIKVYTSGISGNKEVKKRQQRIMMILDSKGIKYEAVDITEPGKEEEKQFMQEHAESKGNRNPLPPQIFNEEQYCGDYDGFDVSNENDNLETFLKLPPSTRVNGAAPVPQPQNDSEKETNHLDSSIRPEETASPEVEVSPIENNIDHEATGNGVVSEEQDEERTEQEAEQNKVVPQPPEPQEGEEVKEVAKDTAEAEDEVEAEAKSDEEE